MRPISPLLLLAVAAAAPAVAQQAQPAVRIPRTVMIDDNYPAQAFRLGEEGDVGLIFDVTEKGRVENCKVGLSSGSKSLDEASCAIFVRIARYRPARDAQGNAVRSSDTTVYKWRLPR